MMMCFKINVHAKLFKMIIVLEPLITQDFIFVGNNFHVPSVIKKKWAESNLKNPFMINYYLKLKQSVVLLLWCSMHRYFTPEMQYSTIDRK